MSNSIQVFDNAQFGSIRAMDVDGQPWFVASDIAKSLGYRMASDMTRRLDEDEKGTRSVRTPSGEQEMTIVTESGLYSAILGSKLPEARAFKRWVTHDVLPSIRSHGMYATPQTVERMLNDPDTMIATLKALKAERQRVAALVEDNARLVPKATAYDIEIEATGTMSVTEAARYLAQIDSSMTRKRLFGYLRADGMICKQDNAPTKTAIERGYLVQMLTTRADGKANSPYAHMTRKGLDWCMRKYCTEHAIA